MSKHINRGQKPAKDNPSQRSRWLAAALFVVMVVVVLVVLQSRPVAPPPTAAPNSNTVVASSSPGTNAAASPSAGQGRLVGSWLRPDGGYVLEIRGATADGKLDARYLNPRPINVARAEWQQRDGKLQVFVELRDVNYPGSTYTLTFPGTGDGSTDRMAGIYFQAAQRQEFEVEFVRQK